jgi:hypothetical protein
MYNMNSERMGTPVIRCEASQDLGELQRVIFVAFCDDGGVGGLGVGA